jgi:hypothetical protein
MSSSPKRITVADTATFPQKIQDAFFDAAFLAFTTAFLRLR